MSCSWGRKFFLAAAVGGGGGEGLPYIKVEVLEVPSRLKMEFLHLLGCSALTGAHH